MYNIPYVCTYIYIYTHTYVLTPTDTDTNTDIHKHNMYKYTYFSHSQHTCPVIRSPWTLITVGTGAAGANS